MTHWLGFGLQEAMGPTMEEFTFFHDYIMVLLCFIVTVVGVMMIGLHGSKLADKDLKEGQLLESIWTLAPTLILVGVAAPSLTLLYSLEESWKSSVTLKVVGHQWYWSYELTDFWAHNQSNCTEFDAYMSPSNLSEDEAALFRLLDTDNRPALPYQTQIRSLVSSADVLHSWAIPSLGVKTDANPGRLNQVSFLSYRPGVAYGQCSEICGANHSFMPISVEFVSLGNFLSWVASE